MSTTFVPMWMRLVSEKKTMVPSAPVKAEMKPVYKDLNEVAKQLFPSQPEEELDDETNENVETEEEEAEAEEENAEDDAAYKKCNTTGCPIKFIPVKNEIRCEECREYNIGMVIPCVSSGCNDYAKMSHKQIKIMKENNYKPFTKCFECSKKKNDNTDFTMVWAYDEKCNTQECEGRIQLNQSKVDFFKQPHMKMPMHCYDCIQERKADKNTNIECECATCGDTVVMSKMQKISVERNHLISCESCRTTMTKNCAHKSCNKPFLSKARETELKTTFKKNYREEPCCSKECFLLFSKK